MGVLSQQEAIFKEGSVVVGWGFPRSLSLRGLHSGEILTIPCEQSIIS